MSHHYFKSILQKEMMLKCKYANVVTMQVILDLNLFQMKTILKYGFYLFSILLKI